MVVRRTAHASGLTWRDLDDLVDRYATGLLRHGVGRDDIVMVQLPNVVELIATYLAAGRIGAMLSPVPVQYRAHELRYVLELAEPKAFITAARMEGFDHLELIRSLRAAASSLEVVIGDAADPGTLPADVVRSPRCSRVRRTVPPWPPPRRPRHHGRRRLHRVLDVGTEADRKGVPRSHNLWISIALATVDGAALETGDALLCPFPRVTMSGTGGMLFPWLLVQGRLVLHQPMALPVFLAQIATEQIAYTVVPPILPNLLLRPKMLEAADLSSIRRIGSGSAPLTRWMTTGWKERRGIDILNFFGSNEGMAIVAAPPEVDDAGERAPSATCSPN